MESQVSDCRLWQVELITCNAYDTTRQAKKTRQLNIAKCTELSLVTAVCSVK